MFSDLAYENHTHFQTRSLRNHIIITYIITPTTKKFLKSISNSILCDKN